MKTKVWKFKCDRCGVEWCSDSEEAPWVSIHTPGSDANDEADLCKACYQLVHHFVFDDGEIDEYEVWSCRGHKNMVHGGKYVPEHKEGKE